MTMSRCEAFRKRSHGVEAGQRLGLGSSSCRWRRASWSQQPNCPIAVDPARAVIDAARVAASAYCACFSSVVRHDARPSRTTTLSICENSVGAGGTRRVFEASPLGCQRSPSPIAACAGRDLYFRSRRLSLDIQ
jgi:hypothetical protein